MAQEIQEAGRQTCRFSGIWSFKIVVDLGLFDAQIFDAQIFDAQRSIYFFFSGRPSDWIDRLTGYQIGQPIWGNKKATFCPSELLWMAQCHLKQTRTKCTTAVLQNFFSQAGPGLPLLGPGGKYGMSLVMQFLSVADRRFHVCCLAEYGSEWPWTKQTLQGLGLVWHTCHKWHKHPAGPVKPFP